MNKKELEKSPHISMEKFLRQYLEISNERVIEILKSLTHQEFKDLYESIYGTKIRRLPFELVTSEDVNMGDVLLVADRKNNSAPYINPKPNEITYDEILEIERQRNIERQVEPESMEEYIDTLDSVAFDPNVSDNIIKTYSKSKKIIRGVNHD